MSEDIIPDNEVFSDEELAIEQVLRPKLFKDFGAWWGRGLQYISFIKN